MNQGDKYEAEFERLMKKHGLIITLLNVLDMDIEVRRELEQVNEMPFHVRPSLEVERTREKWQKHLQEVKRDIWGMLKIMLRHQSGSK